MTFPKKYYILFPDEIACGEECDMLIAELLNDVPLGRKLLREDIQRLDEILSVNTFRKELEPNEILMKSGKTAEYVYLMESGLIRTVNFTPAGEEIFFYHFTRGDFVGLVNMISGTDNFSEYICMKKSCVISIPYANIDRALDEVPAFTRAMLEDISQKSRNLVQLVVASRHKKTRERICAYLFFHYEKTKENTFRTPFTIETLAKTLNLTRSAMSKELHLLEDEGVILLSKKEIYLKDPKKLEENL